MAKKIGVIAGIGNKSTNTNVIMPEFDAAFRLATLSTSVLVIDGLTLSNGILKAGHVVFEGYMCELKNDVSWGDSQQVFLYLGKDDNGLVNSCWFSSEEEAETITFSKTIQRKRIDSNTIGVFNDIIDVSEHMPISQASVSLIVLPSSYEDTETATFNRVAKTIAVTINRNYVSTDNIPDTDTAEYVLSYATKKQNYVQLIYNGLPKITDYYAYPYPRKCKVADMATALVANGTIDSSATATTQPVNDSSAKVATTEFVQKQIENDLNTTKYVASTIVTAYVKKSSTITTSVAKISLYRRARFVYAVVTETVLTDTVMTGAPCTFTLPSGYLPKESFETYFLFRTYYDHPTYGKINSVDYLYRITVSTDGACSGNAVYKNSVMEGTTELTDIAPYNAFGYECQ